MRRITSSMSNGSFEPLAIGAFTLRFAAVLRAGFVSPRARRIAMRARGGKNGARD
jgi:hypothetical protein